MAEDSPLTWIEEQMGSIVKRESEMNMKPNKKAKYARMSSEDFKAICDLLFEDSRRPKVSFTKFGKSYEQSVWKSDQ